jgi:hypothetical protein
MKKTASLIALSLAVVLIVLPVTCFVNQSLDNPALTNPTLRSDGNPFPPLPPNPPAALVADGNPYPPLPPPPGLRSSFGADGNQLSSFAGALGNASLS